MTALSDENRDGLIQTLRNNTQLGRFNAAECAGVLKFIEENGYSITKNEPVKEEPEHVNAAPEGSDPEPAFFETAPQPKPDPAKFPADHEPINSVA